MTLNRQVNYLEDSIPSIFVMLGFPILISSVAAVFLSLIQNKVISAFCPEYFTVFAVLTSFLTVVTNIATSIVSAAWAKYAGSFATKDEKSRNNLVNTFYTTLACQIAAELLVLILTDPILHLLNTPSAIYGEVKTFYILYVLASFFSALSGLALTLINGLESAMGVLAMNIASQAFPCGVLALFLCVFKMNIVGGALFTGIAAACTAVLCFILLLKNKRCNLPRREDMRVNLRECGSILRMATLIFLQVLCCNVGYIAVAAQTNKLLSLDYISVLSISIPITTGFTVFSTMISVAIPQNYLLGRYDRVKKILGSVFGICQLYGVFCFLFYFVVGKYYYATIFSDPTVVEMGAEFWRLSGLGYIAIPALYVIRCFFVAVQMPRVALGAGFCELAGNLFCAYVLIPRFGEIGRSLSQAIGWGIAMLYLFICYFIFRKKIYSRAVETPVDLPQKAV